MYWMSRIVKAHIGASEAEKAREGPDGKIEMTRKDSSASSPVASAASVSVRNSVPHVLPGILLSIGDTHGANNNANAAGNNSASTGNKDTFLPDQTTRALAEQTNAWLQASVRRDGPAYVQHLDSFIVAESLRWPKAKGIN